MTKTLRSPAHAILAPEACRDIEAAAAGAAPGIEACGGLLGVRHAASLDIRRVCAAPGGAAGHFVIQPEEMFRMRARAAADEELLGFWHTHPSGTCALSARDLRAHEAFLRVVPGRVRPERALLIVAGPPRAWSLRWWCDGRGWCPVGLRLPPDA